MNFLRCIAKRSFLTKNHKNSCTSWMDNCFLYMAYKNTVLPISTLLCTLKTVTYPSHQIIKVCNSTTVVFNTLYLNVKTFFMNEYMLDGDLRSYKATTVILEMMINKQNQNSISSLIIREHTRELTAFT